MAGRTRAGTPEAKAASREGARDDRTRLLVSVGGLVARKGHHLAIEAVAPMRDVLFLIAGEGPGCAELERQIAAHGAGERIRLLGALPHEELRGLYGAADASILASRREGWANVLLESMACGTPVVATSVGGTAEVVSRPEAGILVAEGSALSLRAGIETLLRNPPERAATRAHAEKFSWDETAAGTLALFHAVSKRRPGSGSPSR